MASRDATADNKLDDRNKIPRFFPLKGRQINDSIQSGQEDLLNLYEAREQTSEAQRAHVPSPLPAPFFPDLIVPSMVPIVNKYMDCVKERKAKVEEETKATALKELSEKVPIPKTAAW